MRLIVNLALVAAIFAALLPAGAEATQAVAQLQSGEFDALETRFTQLQTRFDRHEATEFELLDAYKVFYQSQDTLSGDFARWIATRPNSWVPRLARGVYLRKLGESARGSGFVGQVPDETLKYLSAMHEQAKSDLNAALAMNPRLYIAALHLLNIAQFEDDDATADRMLSISDKLLPSNITARARYLIHLAPIWGGSEQKMSAYIDKVRRDGVRDETIRLLSAIQMDNIGGLQMQNRATAAAMGSFVRALELSASASPRLRRDYLVFTSDYCPKARILAPNYCE